MTCVDHPNHAGPARSRESFTITAPVAAGTYNLYLYAYNGDAAPRARAPCSPRRASVAGRHHAPTVTINQAGRPGSTRPNAAPINFTVVFSEPVTGFATGDVTLERHGRRRR